eukprot:gene54968-11858_t
MATHLPDINSHRPPLAGHQKDGGRSKSSMAGPPPAGPPPGAGPRSETSLGNHGAGPGTSAALQPTGVPWLDDMQQQLRAEAAEATKVGGQAGMHSGFATKFGIPQPPAEHPPHQGGGGG